MLRKLLPYLISLTIYSCYQSGREVCGNREEGRRQVIIAFTIVDAPVSNYESDVSLLDYLLKTYLASKNSRKDCSGYV